MKLKKIAVLCLAGLVIAAAAPVVSTPVFAARGGERAAPDEPIVGLGQRHAQYRPLGRRHVFRQYAEQPVRLGEYGLYGRHPRRHVQYHPAAGHRIPYFSLVAQIQRQKEFLRRRRLPPRL